jgi:hypothetical protein
MGILEPTVCFFEVGSTDYPTFSTDPMHDRHSAALRAILRTAIQAGGLHGFSPR